MAEGSKPTPRSAAPPAWLQRAVVGHLAVMVVGLAWAYGGQSPWARQGLLAWGSVGILLLIGGSVVASRARGSSLLPSLLRWLWPLLLFDALTLASCYNPSMTAVTRLGSTFFVSSDPPHGWLPSSARPELTLRELWQFNGIVLSCFNAFLLVHRRSLLRLLLAVVAGNAMLLAILGTFQKLVGAPGLWFGLVPSPQPRFFATFIYHNHWGAFTVMNSAVCLGLLFHTWRRHTYRDIWHSPLPIGALATLLLAATIPLSASRSSTLLVGILLASAVWHALLRIRRSQRELGRSALLPAGLLLAVCALCLAGAVYLGREVIADRARTTSQQLTTASGVTAFGSFQENYFDSRMRLYRDTWRMAMVHPYTGWGLETYATVFRIYDSSPYPLVAGGRFRTLFTEAHSDWLQSVAESGLVGTALLVLLGVLPLSAFRWRDADLVIPRYLLAGCGLLLLYAWVEFPFANPSVMVGFWSGLYVACRYGALDQAARNRQTRERTHA